MLQDFIKAISAGTTGMEQLSERITRDVEGARGLFDLAHILEILTLITRIPPQFY